MVKKSLYDMHHFATYYSQLHKTLITAPITHATHPQHTQRTLNARNTRNTQHTRNAA